MDQDSNQQFFDDLVTELANQGIKTGIYTSYSQWSQIMGDDFTDGSQFPLWYPHYQSPPDPSFDDFTPFGGWDEPAIKQYAENQSLCGVGVDVNVY